MGKFVSRVPASPAHCRRLTRALLIGSVGLLVMVVAPAAVFAGQAASGELFFYPCTSCHPVSVPEGSDQPTKRLPNGFKGHEIVLKGHSALGRGEDACLACHDDPERDPGKLKLADGTFVDIKGDVAAVCYRCHSTKYKEWKAGTHGRHQAKCTSGGCHDPHTPGYIYAPPLRPFVGNGFQFKVLTEREAFKPLMAPAPPPPVRFPGWYVAVAVLGAVVAGGLTVKLVSGRSTR
jgi:hypothetical protein